jgi:hypothetical protein
MRIVYVAIVAMGCWMRATPAVAADDIRVEEVTGQAWYGAGDAPRHLLQAGNEIGLGTLSTANDGLVYASPVPGSEFRLAGDSKLRIESDGWQTGPAGEKQRNFVVDLSEGKITTSSRSDAAGDCVYQIRLAGGRISVGSGLCVICVHGDGCHLYVARGSITLYPLHGPLQQKGVRIDAKASIGVLSNSGEVSFQAMNQTASGTSNCLMSGVTPEIVRRFEVGSPNPANLEGNPPVSATE